jgi:tRNA dimethylallyltransferase
MDKLIVILGPTASGKTSLSIKLAKRFNGAVISADSRQVYKGMDLGAGKVTKKEMAGIPHYLLDVVSPKQRFSAAQYQKMAFRAIDKVIKKGQTPFLVGGSAFYIYSVVEGWQFPSLKANLKLRQRLAKKPVNQLLAILKKLDQKRAKNIDVSNSRRLIRAIEIAKAFGKVPKLQKVPRYNCLLLGVKKDQQQLVKLIRLRLLERLKQGMAAEVKKLRAAGLSWKKLDDFGLEYRWLARYLRGKVTKGQMIECLQKDIEHFAKRQMTWFKKDSRIEWVTTKTQAAKLIKKFIN